MSNLWKREPAVIIGVLQAAIVLAIAFGLSLSVEQTEAILAFLAAITALITRQNVSSP